MRIVFMGTPDFAARALEAILAAPGHECLAVFTQPDKPRGRGQKVSFSPVKSIALVHGIPVYQPEKIRQPEVREELARLNPDVIVVAAYGKILPVEILNLPPLGCINIHASLLPRYRGAAPIHWAIMNGEKETGITIMQMDEGMDTGDILAMESIPLGQDAQTGEIYEALALLGGRLLLETLAGLEAGNIQPVKQEEALATYAPMLDKGHEIIDWKRTAQQIHNQIRGMNPWPGVYTFFRKERLKVARSRLVNQVGTYDPGRIIGFSEDGILVGTVKGVVALSMVQPAGKKPMNARDFINGYKVQAGEMLGEC